MNLRVAALGAGDPLPAEPLAADVAPAPEAVVEAVFDGSPLATPLYARAALGTGSEVTGPCIVLEEGCTTLVPPGWRGTTTPDGHLLLERASVSVDPVSVEVIRNAFNSIARQMNNNLARSAYTPIIYEMKDCSVGIFDAEARLLGQSPGLPMFLGNLETGIVATTEALGGPEALPARRRVHDQRPVPRRQPHERRRRLLADLPRRRADRLRRDEGALARHRRQGRGDGRSTRPRSSRRATASARRTSTARASRCTR